MKDTTSDVVLITNSIEHILTLLFSLAHCACMFVLSLLQLVSEAYADWYWRRMQDREGHRVDQRVDPTWYFRYMEDRESHRGDPSWIFEVGLWCLPNCRQSVIDETSAWDVAIGLHVLQEQYNCLALDNIPMVLKV